MKMSPCKLILMRMYNVTLGRFACTDRLLRKILVKVLVGEKKKDTYNQASSYFSHDQLKDK